jgi:hypothetical protein
MSAAPRRSASRPATAKRQAPLAPLPYSDARAYQPLPYDGLEEVIDYISSEANLRSSVGASGHQQATSPASASAASAAFAAAASASGSSGSSDTESEFGDFQVPEENPDDYDSGDEEPSPEERLRDLLLSVAPAWPRANRPSTFVAGPKWVPIKGKKLGRYGRYHFDRVMALFARLARAADPKRHNAYTFAFWVRVAEVFKDFVDLHMGSIMQMPAHQYQQRVYHYQAVFGLVLAGHMVDGPFLPHRHTANFATLKQIERLAYLLI